MSEELAIKSTGGIKPETTTEERTWAVLAHLSTLLTLIISLGTAGLGGLIFVFVPLVIYLVYKDKSRFIAYQSAQAFVIQVIGTLGLFIAILAVVLVIVLIWVITGVLSAILIGLILIPIAVIITVVLILALLAYPFVLSAFSIAAAVQTGSGEDYRSPYLGQWVADWLARYEAGSDTAPAA